MTNPSFNDDRFDNDVFATHGNRIKTALHFLNGYIPISHPYQAELI